MDLPSDRSWLSKVPEVFARMQQVSKPRVRVSDKDRPNELIKLNQDRSVSNNILNLRSRITPGPFSGPSDSGILAVYPHINCIDFFF